ncbi:Interleukin-15 [Galemys pyrenaicus]|uniref:Interleukin n=1 Tax=Galemys pyrenaicus TaxID=202257 RepID=A0A8J6APH4_GALPY|nr:Interleukin-15 [Galemys pyrenaicus]
MTLDHNTVYDLQELATPLQCMSPHPPLCNRYLPPGSLSPLPWELRSPKSDSTVQKKSHMKANIAEKRSVRFHGHARRFVVKNEPCSQLRLTPPGTGNLLSESLGLLGEIHGCNRNRHFFSHRRCPSSVVGGWKDLIVLCPYTRLLRTIPSLPSVPPFLPLQCPIMGSSLDIRGSNDRFVCIFQKPYLRGTSFQCYLCLLLNSHFLTEAGVHVFIFRRALHLFSRLLLFAFAFSFISAGLPKTEANWNYVMHDLKKIKDLIQPECKVTAMKCFLLELHVISHESKNKNITETVENLIILANSSLSSVRVSLLVAGRAMVDAQLMLDGDIFSWITKGHGE